MCLSLVLVAIWCWLYNVIYILYVEHRFEGVGGSQFEGLVVTWVDESTVLSL